MGIQEKRFEVVLLVVAFVFWISLGCSEVFGSSTAYTLVVNSSATIGPYSFQWAVAQANSLSLKSVTIILNNSMVSVVNVDAPDLLRSFERLVIEGNGVTVNKTSSSGAYILAIQDSSNILIENTNFYFVSDAMDSMPAIETFNCTNTTIFNCTFHNAGATVNGGSEITISNNIFSSISQSSSISLLSTSNSNISQNTVIDSVPYGIILRSSTNTTVCSNTISSGDIAFFASINSSVINNTVTGSDGIFFESSNSSTVMGNVVNSTGIFEGIGFYDCHYSSIVSNRVSVTTAGTQSVGFTRSPHTYVYDNTLTEGIFFRLSDDSHIHDNMILSHFVGGISFNSLSDCYIYSNNITVPTINQFGVFFSSVQNCQIYGNKITTVGVSIYLETSSLLQVYSNILNSASSFGMEFIGLTYSDIYSNSAIGVRAIQLKMGNMLNISSNHLVGTESGLTMGQCNNMNLIQNQIQGYNYGVYAENSVNCLFLDNVVTTTVYNGHFWHFCNGFVLSGDSVTSTMDIAIMVQYCIDSSVRSSTTTSGKGNIYFENSIGGDVTLNFIAICEMNSGIHLLNCSQFLIDSNYEIHGTASTEGITLVDSSFCNLTSNVVVNHQIGISFINSTNNLIGSSFIYNNLGRGISIDCSSGNLDCTNGIESNCIGLNGGGGITIVDHPPPVIPQIDGISVSSLTDGSEEITVSSSVVGIPNSYYLFQFFANSQCDSSGFGQGDAFLGSQTVQSISTGNATASFSFNPMDFNGVPSKCSILPDMCFITATITLLSSSTSNQFGDATGEFSKCFFRCNISSSPTATQSLTTSATVTPSLTKTTTQSLTETITITQSPTTFITPFTTMPQTPSSIQQSSTVRNSPNISPSKKCEYPCVPGFHSLKENGANKKVDEQLKDGTVQKVEYEFTSKDEQQTTVLTVVLTSGFVIGELIFPNGTMPKGAIVTIEESTLPLPEKNHGKKCSNNANYQVPENKRAKPVAPVWKITVKNGPSKGFDPPVKINLLVPVFNGSNHCLGVNTKGNRNEWKCEQTKLQNGQYSSILKGKTTHFTSFAAIFGFFNFGVDNCSPGDSKLWIACVVISGVLVSIGVVIIILDRRSKRFHDWVHGYQGNAITQLVNIVKNISTR